MHPLIHDLKLGEPGRNCLDIELGCIGQQTGIARVTHGESGVMLMLTASNERGGVAPGFIHHNGDGDPEGLMHQCAIMSVEQAKAVMIALSVAISRHAEEKASDVV